LGGTGVRVGLTGGPGAVVGAIGVGGMCASERSMAGQQGSRAVGWRGGGLAAHGRCGPLGRLGSVMQGLSRQRSTKSTAPPARRTRESATSFSASLRAWLEGTLISKPSSPV
jgi:hypothetical protein